LRDFEQMWAIYGSMPQVSRQAPESAVREGTRCRLPPSRRRGTGAATIFSRIRRMLEVLAFISYLLTLYIYILIAAAVLSWLVAFNVVNSRNQFVATIGNFLYQITEPVLRPIRNMLPNLGGIDVSPIIVILVIFFIQSVVIPILARALV
jgi:YggT family protein